MDQIELRGWRFMTVIGALAEEQLRPQPVEVDATLFVDLEAAGSSDDLARTVNYGDVLDVLDKVGAVTHVLLESLANDLVDAAFTFPAVDEVEIVVRKLRPPVPHDVAHTGVRLRRRRLASHPDGAHEAIIALGSNMGDRERYLRFAVDELGAGRRSQVWETEPVGGPEHQGAFLNMVVVVHTHLDPFALLRKCNRIERDAGRRREVHWGPRTLDLDVLFYDDLHIDSPELTIPHPRLGERRFVLAPLDEVAPDRCPPGWQDRLADEGVQAVGPLH